MNQKINILIRTVSVWLVCFTAAFCIVIQSSKSYCEQWTFLGLEGEEINSIKQGGSFLYACTEDGIFRKDISVNDNWIPCGLQGSEVGDILITSPSQEILFAGITLESQYVPPGDDVTMYKSTDGGASWSPSGSGMLGISINTILPHPGTQEIIYAAGSLYIVRSLDGGTNWNEINYSFGGFNCFAVGDIAPFPIYAGGSTGSQEPLLTKSTDNGETWDSVSDFRFDPDISSDGRIYSIAIDPENSNILYTYYDGSICKFIDGGNAYVQIPVEDMYLYSLKIDPKDRNHFYAGGGKGSQRLGLHESKDACETWRRIRSPEGALEILTIIFDQNSSDIIYIATASGVYKFLNAPSALPTNTWGDY